MQNAKIVAVIVTYEPALHTLDRLMKRLEPQCAATIVVDNGSTNDISSWFSQRQWRHAALITMERNVGLAAAQNAGIAWSREQHATHVVLFDQDSEPEHDMVETLFHAADELAHRGERVGAVGPRIVDSRHDDAPPFRKVEGFRIVPCGSGHSNDKVPVDYLIASGCLIPLKVIDRVGPMHEAFFIDYVDIEWGLRARHEGFRSFGVCNAILHHHLGDDPLIILGKKYPLHSPLRHYYHFRNAVWLYRQRWTPLRWKVADAKRLVLKYITYSLFAPSRRKHFAMMTTGVTHGLRQKLGPYHQPPPGLAQGNRRLRNARND